MTIITGISTLTVILLLFFFGNALVLGLVLIHVLLVVGMLFLNAASARRVNKALTAVTDAMKAIATGQLDRRVIPEGGPQIASIAEAFNLMGDGIRATIHDLDGQRKRLGIVLDTMLDGVVVIDESGRSQLINPAAREMLQAEDGEFVQIRDNDLVYLARESLQTNERRQSEIEIIPGQKYILATATSVGGGLVLVTMHDLTAGRQLEITRREFVSNVSHELRNPLAAISAMVETLESGALEERGAAEDFVARIREEAERMNELVSDLLSLARVESGREQMELEVSDIAPELRDACDRARLRTKSSAPMIQIDVADGLLIKADMRRVMQIVDNLLDNAIRFTPEDGVITVQGSHREEMVLISVRDTGEGIPPEHLPHIFERFYKVDPSRSDPGTGLGLAIARHIAQSHGGNIDVRSVVGKGTTFDVLLPSVRYVNNSLTRSTPSH